MTSDRNQREWGEAVKAIAAVIGLMIAVFTLLGIFLPTNLIQPIGALIVGLILTAILVWMGKLEWGRALITWLMVSMGLIILYLIVSRPATVVGSVVDNSSSPVKGLTLVLTDANGVDHKAITDENGTFEIKNVSEGKFTISANGELLISGRVPSGWKQIIDSQLEIGSLVHKPNPTVAATPTIVAVVIPDTPTPAPLVPTDTPLPSPTPTHTLIPSTATNTSQPTVTNTSEPRPTNTPVLPTNTPVPSPTNTSVSSSSTVANVERLGIWEYQGSRPRMPNPANPGQVILANGDIDNSGTCHIKVFNPGEPVQGLGEGTFQLWLISGTLEQIEAAITKTQDGAAKDSGGSCPRLPSTSPSAVRVDFLGLWEYRGSRPPMPKPPDQGQVILANGDIDNSGTCHIKVFGPGEPVQGLGEGTFELRLITGTPEQIEALVANTQDGSAKTAGGSCPRLP